MKFAQVLIASASLLALSTVASKAATVCNEEGDCWRTKQVYDYRPEFKVTVQDDKWQRDEKKFRMREDRDDRGYYKGGVWIGF